MDALDPTLTAAAKRAEQEAAFWARRGGEFREKYPDQFIAVHDDQVVVASDDLRHLLEQLEARGLDAGAAWVRFIPSPSHRFVL